MDPILQVFEAVERPLRRLYGPQRPRHLAAAERWARGGPDPLDGVSIFWNPHGHWHYVGFGMAEHGEKRSDIPHLSGWGFEPTFRLTAPAGVLEQAARGELDAVRAQAPAWPIELMNDVGRMVFREQTMLAHGHTVRRPGAAIGEGLGLLADSELTDPVETSNGRFSWLQLVLLSDGELAHLEADDWKAWLAERERLEPCWTVCPSNRVEGP